MQNLNRVEELNLATTIITLPNHDKSKPFGKATGFFYRSKKEIYLVTNYHVVSGRNPITQKCIDKGGHCDFSELVIHLMMNKLGNWKALKIPLVDNKGSKHYKHIQGKDVAVINVTSLLVDPDFRPVVCVNDHENEKALIRVGEKVTLLGNPNGYSTHGVFPIWKVGYIASEPNIDEDDNFVIDAKTFGGMSGSAVMIWRSNEGFQTQTYSYINGNHCELMGVYSDRPHTLDFATNKFTEMGLGTVWKRKCIDELIN